MDQKIQVSLQQKFYLSQHPTMNWIFMLEENISSINNGIGIFSEVSCVTNKLGLQQTVNDHPEHKGHVILCNLVSPSSHLETIFGW